jgi:uncharacterized zinc-type alcohol dehydrogenase-like protein
MTSQTAALASRSAGGPLTRHTVERRDLRPDDVRIDIAFCGVCHSDLHRVFNEWGGGTRYPIVPGHEIAGLVSAVGSEVTKHAVGDRVGVGCLVDSCGECEMCLTGEEPDCDRAVGTYDAIGQDGKLTYGGYSKQVVVTERFVVRIPDAIALEQAAPLLCAGITTYNPLKRYQVAGKSVAVLGFGGLGHLGVKLGVAMGAEVTVLSQTLDKRDDGLAYGAGEYHATSDPATFDKLSGRFDVILSTVSANLPVDDYLRLLRREGAMVLLGIPSRPDHYSAASLLNGRKILTGSNIGGIPDTQEVLDLCAARDIRPKVEVVEAGEMDAVYRRVLASKVRYRAVLDVATI